MEESTLIFGLRKQSKWGDINEQKPAFSPFSHTTMKSWEAWYDHFGKTKQQATIEFIDIAKEVLITRGLSVEDATREAAMKNFQACLDVAVIPDPPVVPTIFLNDKQDNMPDFQT